MTLRSTRQETCQLLTVAFCLSACRYCGQKLVLDHFKPSSETVHCETAVSCSFARSQNFLQGDISICYQKVSRTSAGYHDILEKFGDFVLLQTVERQTIFNVALWRLLVASLDSRHCWHRNTHSQISEARRSFRRMAQATLAEHFASYGRTNQDGSQKRLSWHLTITLI